MRRARARRWKVDPAFGEMHIDVVSTRAGSGSDGGGPGGSRHSGGAAFASPVSESRGAAGPALARASG